MDASGRYLFAAIGNRLEVRSTGRADTATDPLGENVLHTDVAFSFGAVPLTVDPDVSGLSLLLLPDDTSGLTLSDDRFEIVGNSLKLKADRHVTESFDQAELALRSGPNDSDLEMIFVLEVSSRLAWQNANDLLDVNDDGFVTALDALVIINRLDANPESVLGVRPVELRLFYDTSGDG